MCSLILDWAPLRVFVCFLRFFAEAVSVHLIQDKQCFSSRTTSPGCRTTDLLFTMTIDKRPTANPEIIAIPLRINGVLAMIWIIDTNIVLRIATDHAGSLLSAKLFPGVWTMFHAR
jgi:hypothetical protein